MHFTYIFGLALLVSRVVGYPAEIAEDAELTSFGHMDEDECGIGGDDLLKRVPCNTDVTYGCKNIQPYPISNMTPD